MCAIVDTNVLGKVFGDNPTDAGKFFYDWLNKPRGGILVTGGTKFKDETNNNANFARVLRERINAGRARQVPDADVDAETDRLDAMDKRGAIVCKSNDKHILALAIVSHTRILFTNDGDLQGDFKNSDIIDAPRGKVYTTSMRMNAQRNMLSARNVRQICRYCRNRR